MGSSEKFCLRWNDFQENISSAFRELRDDSDFFDVTLACGDHSDGIIDSKRSHHRLVRAHKVILSACSVFFKDILRSMNVGHNSNNQQPLIYLRGIKYDDLQSILDFMYFGQVNIAQERLNDFLAVAEELRVKGLSPSESSATNTSSPSASTSSSTKRPFLPSKTLTPSTLSAKKQRLVASKLRPHEEPRDIKIETGVVPANNKERVASKPVAAASIHSGSKFEEDFGVGNVRSLDDFEGAEDYLDNMNETGADGSESNKEYDDDGYGYDEPEAEVMIEEGEDMVATPSSSGASSAANSNLIDIPDYRHRIRQLIKIDRITNQPYCTICNQAGSNYETVANHVEARHIQRREYMCQYCGKGFKTKNHKAVHIHRVHREEHKLAKVFGAGVELN